MGLLLTERIFQSTPERSSDCTIKWLALQVWCCDWGLGTRLDSLMLWLHLLYWKNAWCCICTRIMDGQGIHEIGAWLLCDVAVHMYVFKAGRHVPFSGASLLPLFIWQCASKFLWTLIPCTTLKPIIFTCTFYLINLALGIVSSIYFCHCTVMHSLDVRDRTICFTYCMCG